MTTTLEVEVNHATGGTTNLDDEAIRAEIWRTVNAVGRFNIVCYNQGGALNGVFGVQDEIEIDINGTRVFEGWIDGPGVTLMGRQTGSTFHQLISLQGVDRVQDMLFHNDFDYYYPQWYAIGARIQRLDDALWQVFMVQLPATNPTNISYAVPGVAPPNVGGFEFREGGSFIGGIQELHNRADYLFYVQDGVVAGFYPLQSFAPGGAPCGVIYSTTGAYHIIKYGDLQEHQGDKLYNWVKVYGKNPMFDAWTEYYSALWSNAGLGATVITDDGVTIAPVLGNYYSVRANNAAINPILELDFTGNAVATNYASVDLTKGEIGAWVLYSGGTALNLRPIRVTIQETAAAGGNTMNYYGTSTMCYLDRWGWVSAPIGENVNIGAGAANEWWPIPVGDFDWDQVENIQFRYEALAGDKPVDLYVDGLSLPLPPIAISTIGPGLLRRRPLILNTSDIRTQRALDGYATAVRTHSDNTGVNYVKFMGVGHTAGGNVLRYGGQDFTLNIPEHGIVADIYYAVNIHHVCEPRQDVTDGYGYDYITEVEAIPVDTVAYDSARLGYYAWMPPYRAAYHGSTGSRMK